MALVSLAILTPRHYLYWLHREDKTFRGLLTEKSLRKHNRCNDKKNKEQWFPKLTYSTKIRDLQIGTTHCWSVLDLQNLTNTKENTSDSKLIQHGCLIIRNKAIFTIQKSLPFVDNTTSQRQAQWIDSTGRLSKLNSFSTPTRSGITRPSASRKEALMRRQAWKSKIFYVRRFIFLYYFVEKSLYLKKDNRSWLNFKF